MFGFSQHQIWPISSFSGLSTQFRFREMKGSSTWSRCTCLPGRFAYSGSAAFIRLHGGSHFVNVCVYYIQRASYIYIYIHIHVCVSAFVWTYTYIYIICRFVGYAERERGGVRSYEPKPKNHRIENMCGFLKKMTSRTHVMHMSYPYIYIPMSYPCRGV
jgi:hypothetical protein